MNVHSDIHLDRCVVEERRAEHPLTRALERGSDVRRLRVVTDVVEIGNESIDADASGEFNDAWFRHGCRRADRVGVCEFAGSADLPADPAGKRTRDLRLSTTLTRSCLTRGWAGCGGRARSTWPGRADQHFRTSP